MRTPSELRSVVVAHRPHLDGAVQALVSRDIVRPVDEGFEWGSKAAHRAAQGDLAILAANA